MTKKKHEAGVCPCCGADDLDYGVLRVQDDNVGYPWSCLNCGAVGTEWYELTFSEHDVDEEGNNPMEDDDGAE